MKFSHLVLLVIVCGSLVSDVALAVSSSPRPLAPNEQRFAQLRTSTDVALQADLSAEASVEKTAPVAMAEDMIKLVDYHEAAMDFSREAFEYSNLPRAQKDRVFMQSLLSTNAVLKGMQAGAIRWLAWSVASLFEHSFEGCRPQTVLFRMMQESVKQMTVAEQVSQRQGGSPHEDELPPEAREEAFAAFCERNCAAEGACDLIRKFAAGAVKLNLFWHRVHENAKSRKTKTVLMERIARGMVDEGMQLVQEVLDALRAREMPEPKKRTLCTAVNHGFKFYQNHEEAKIERAARNAAFADAVIKAVIGIAMIATSVATAGGTAVVAASAAVALKALGFAGIASGKLVTYLGQAKKNKREMRTLLLTTFSDIVAGEAGTNDWETCPERVFYMLDVLLLIFEPEEVQMDEEARRVFKLVQSFDDRIQAKEHGLTTATKFMSHINDFWGPAYFQSEAVKGYNKAVAAAAAEDA